MIEVVFLVFIGVIFILLLLLYLIFFPRAVFYMLGGVKIPNKKDRVLVFAPHPDDETLGCFGYMHRAVNFGSRVKVIIITDGHILAHPKRRYGETEEALSKIGIKKEDIAFLGYGDRTLRKAEDVIKRFKGVINSFKPTIILATSKYDTNTDHLATYKALKYTLRKIKGKKPEVLYYLIHYLDYPVPKGFHPGAYLTPPANLIKPKEKWLKLTFSKNEQKAKREAIMKYKSQLKFKIFFARETLLSFIRRNELFMKE